MIINHDLRINKIAEIAKKERENKNKLKEIRKAKFREVAKEIKTACEKFTESLGGQCSPMPDEISPNEFRLSWEGKMIYSVHVRFFNNIGTRIYTVSRMCPVKEQYGRFSKPEFCQISLFGYKNEICRKCSVRDKYPQKLYSGGYQRDIKYMVYPDRRLERFFIECTIMDFIKFRTDFTEVLIDLCEWIIKYGKEIDFVSLHDRYSTSWPEYSF